MSAPAPIEAIVLRTNTTETKKNGLTRTVTLLLPNDGSHAFEGMVGERLHLLCLKLNDDETVAGSSSGRTDDPDDNPETNKYYLAWRQRVIDYLGGKCVLCGTVDGLEVDHIYPSQKSSPISERWSYAWESQIDEINKCQLLCNGCHIDKHGAVHGTISRYRHHRCRCDACRAAWNEACRRWKARDSENAGSSPAPASRPKRQLSLAQRCAITCGELSFRRFVRHARFPGGPIPTAEQAAEYVREALGVESRSELDQNEEAAERWRTIEADYHQWLRAA